MTDGQWFILAILGLIVLNNMARRFTRSRLVKHLHDNEVSAQDIKTIMKAYEGDQ